MKIIRYFLINAKSNFAFAWKLEYGKQNNNKKNLQRWQSVGQSLALLFGTYKSDNVCTNILIPYLQKLELAGLTWTNTNILLAWSTVPNVFVILKRSHLNIIFLIVSLLPGASDLVWFDWTLYPQIWYKEQNRKTKHHYFGFEYWKWWLSIFEYHNNQSWSKFHY